MGTFFSVIVKIFDIILLPFRDLPPFFGFSCIALFTGYLAVAIFKYVSDQKALKEIMNRIKVHFAEILLYRDDIRQILFAQKEILKYNFFYFIRTIKPAIPIVAIVLMILSQMNLRYSFRPISADEPLVVKVSMSNNPEVENTEDVILYLPYGFEAVSPAFHLAAEQIEWNIKSSRTGEFDLAFQAGKNIFHKKVLIGKPTRPFSPHLGKQGFVEKVFNPLEELLPNNSPIEAIDLGYQARTFNLGVFGWSIHWLVAFLVIAIAFGLFCRKLLKVS
jgi:hypothetical protein